MLASKLPADGFAVPWRMLLPALYPEGVIPLSDIAEQYFNMSERQAKEKAAAHALPIPCSKLGSQKSPWVVSVDDFIELVDARTAHAREVWQLHNGVAA
ncbi:MAG: pyocin activator protein PrtN [Gammaproteobacteria bacterium]|nr:MAG: pyocin activator protein PrtN [Gammaproteobacteria bacterium]